MEVRPLTNDGGHGFVVGHHCLEEFALDPIVIRVLTSMISERDREFGPYVKNIKVCYLQLAIVTFQVVETVKNHYSNKKLIAAPFRIYWFLFSARRALRFLLHCELSLSSAGS